MMGSPVVSDKLVFIGSRDFNLYAIDREKGYCHWNKSYPRGWALANVFHDSVLYVGTSDDRVLIAADPRLGRELWRTNVGFNIFGAPSFSASMAYVGTLMGKVYALDLKSGEVRWTFGTDGYKKNRLKYFKEDDSYRDDIYSIIKSNEQLVDVEYELGAIFSTPIIYGDKMFITSTDGSIYCLKR
jgi:eukaryotic-like serine/threonine-protein kinase